VDEGFIPIPLGIGSQVWEVQKTPDHYHDKKGENFFCRDQPIRVDPLRDPAWGLLFDHFQKRLV
jgi:hypothetical protein